MYLTDLKLRYVESTPLEEERRVDIKESPARILMYSALCGCSVTKRGVENETRSGGSVTKGGVENGASVQSATSIHTD